MKKTLFAIIAMSLSVPAFAQTAVETKTEMTESQKAMYFLGTAFFQQVKMFEFTSEERDYIKKGFTDAVDGTPENLDMAKYNSEVQKILNGKYEKMVSKEKEKGKAFLEKVKKENKKLKPQTLKSGVLYVETKKGKGASPKETDVVKVNYHGTFDNGKVFDSTKDRNQPAEFPLNGVIPCWTQGVQKMKVGGTAILVCPPDMAYGERGAGPIPGGATLKFEVELLEIVPPQPEEEPVPAPEEK